MMFVQECTHQMLRYRIRVDGKTCQKLLYVVFLATLQTSPAQPVIKLRQSAGTNCYHVKVSVQIYSPFSFLFVYKAEYFLREMLNGLCWDDSYTVAQWLEHRWPQANVPGSCLAGDSNLFLLSLLHSLKQ